MTVDNEIAERAQETDEAYKVFVTEQLTLFSKEIAQYMESLIKDVNSSTGLVDVMLTFERNKQPMLTLNIDTETVAMTTRRLLFAKVSL